MQAQARTQAKTKAAQLQQEVVAAQSDRDELQKKYEAKSRCVRCAECGRRGLMHLLRC